MFDSAAHMGDHGRLTALMGQNADDDHLTLLDGKVLAFADGILGEWIRRCLGLDP
jgi:hypothetical protein